MIPTAVSVRLEYRTTNLPRPMHYAAFDKHSETLCFIPLDVMPVSEDSRRIEWLTSHHHMRLRGTDELGWGIMDASNGLTLYAEGATFREAIDAAMAKEKA